MQRKLLVPLFGLLALCVLGSTVVGDDAVKEKKDKKEKKSKVDPKAVARARKTVKMLDDIYKSTIVLVTDKYVNKKEDYPAGRAAIVLFKQISSKGGHVVRLIDVSGEPYSAKNVADDDFETEGVKQLKAGKEYYEKVVTEKGKPYLRAITAVPVVMDKCVTCHPNYKSAKKGEAIGALTYKLEIE